MENCKAPNRNAASRLLFLIVMCTVMSLARFSLSESLDTNVVCHSGVIKGDDVKSSLGVFNHTDESINARNRHCAWIGNHWVPPDGLPVCSVAKVRAACKRFNIVWIGDSTGRRACAVLRGALTAPNP